METKNINLVYYSATYTTRSIVRRIAERIGGKVTEYDITQHAPDAYITAGPEDLLIVGVPVYAGRIPAGSSEALGKFKTDGAPAIITCVYGNRDYDDALLELKDTAEANGFRVVSAGAFIARHSIFPEVGTDRPDKKDMDFIDHFAEKSAEIIRSVVDTETLADIKVKGNHPYKTPGRIPLQPKGNRRCNECGTCVKLCPVQAIAANTPRKTDKQKCISCGRCIVVCPQKARHFGGLVYKMAGKKFTKAYSSRKEPATAYAQFK